MTYFYHDDEYEPTETRPCETCGGEAVWLNCQCCQGEGWVNRHEEDPLWYPDEDIRCTACAGTGGDWYCEACAAKAVEVGP